MKANFKPLGLAAAVATASAGYAGVVNADAHTRVANNGLGDLALVPYYTVREGYGTGIHVINTSDRTQVVKFRFRRASDSLDALDFNIILSPYDEWTGFMNDTDGTIAVTTQDSTCTAPLFEDGRFEMPNIYRSGADEGYIEVIAMGSPTTETAPLAVNAKHAPGGDPKNCQYVENNFLDANYGAGLTPADARGIHNNALSLGEIDSTAADGTVTTSLQTTAYEDGGNFMKVSWFIRDASAGLEFGNDAVHIADFETSIAMMSHQEQGIFSGNTRGFDFPDLDGSSPATVAPNLLAGGTGTWTPARGKYNALRDGSVLGVTDVLNDWSNNPDLNVGTDWIITIPGQYLMLDLPAYLGTLGNPGGLDPSTPGGVIGGRVDAEGNPITCDANVCDFRDIPVIADFTVYDREENLADVPPGDRDVVISPSIPGAPPTSTLLRYEVNVVHWGEEVMDSDYDEVDVSGLVDLLSPATSGWASLAITSNPGTSQKVCSWLQNNGFDPRPPFDPNNPIMDCSVDATGSAPMIGYVAWERSFPANPDGNYGRAVNHSFESGSD